MHFILFSWQDLNCEIIQQDECTYPVIVVVIVGILIHSDMKKAEKYKNKIMHCASEM